MLPAFVHKQDGHEHKSFQLSCFKSDYGIDDGKWHLIYMISDEHIAERLLIKTQKPTPAPKCSSASSRRS